jgi:hypothetical protein
VLPYVAGAAAMLLLLVKLLEDSMSAGLGVEGAAGAGADDREGADCCCAAATVMPKLLGVPNSGTCSMHKGQQMQMAQQRCGQTRVNRAAERTLCGSNNCDAEVAGGTQRRHLQHAQEQQRQMVQQRCGQHRLIELHCDCCAAAMVMPRLLRVPNSGTYSMHKSSRCRWYSSVVVQHKLTELQGT